MTNEQKIIKKLKRCISEIEAVIDDLEAVNDGEAEFEDVNISYLESSKTIISRACDTIVMLG